MTRTGTKYGNWAWRFEKEQLTDEVSHRLHDLTRLYDRVHKTLP
ncbi:hypothetical protein [Candidatus Nitronereus thalassa]|uniref:Uncharacterized protein n=1 Tax=Candidatus Nitronereus thalassa TaxID=3020898 RepID=A0ABU3K5Y1_9BACT|nr:hypothetical protein [Candidatus Nitronereus thalassa]MDT7041765.1 hypothetical protein [Candidatus Nitronereus thalassa]